MIKDQHLQKFFFYLGGFALGTALYLAIFLTFREEVVRIPLLGSLAALTIACLGSCGILFLMFRRTGKSALIPHDYFILFLITFFFNYNIYGLIPFNASRSNSIIMLSYLNNQNGNLSTKQEITDHVQSLYFGEYDAIGRRLAEQVSAGNAIEIDGKYTITPRGELSLLIFSVVTDLYRMDHNFARKLDS